MTVVDLPYPFEEGHPVPFDTVSVNLYRKAKWGTLIPLPFGKQTPPPTGFSGRHAKVPDTAKYKEWILESRRGAKQALGGKRAAGPYNIALIHGFDTIAIDVDDYEYIDKKTRKKERKLGGKSLKKLEAELGKLPATWISSARGAPDKNPSGQRFFRLKPEHATNKLRYNDKPADSIEIVRAGHRYSVVWPSLNGRLGHQYLWWKRVNVSGTWMWRASDVPPRKDELPYLPDKWVEFLTSGFTPYSERRKIEPGVLSSQDMQSWISERALNGSLDESGKGDLHEPSPCREMQSAIKIATDQLEESSGGSHDIMRNRLWHAMQLAAEGHSGIKVFLSTLHDIFVEEVQGRRDGGAREAEEEWQRLLIGGFEGAVARKEPISTVCRCIKSDAEGYEGFRMAIDPADVVQNDDGNAELLVSISDGNLRWISGADTWMVWNREQGIWEQNNEAATVLARGVSSVFAERAKELFQHIADNDPDDRELVEKRAKLLYKWSINSGNRGRIHSMLDLAKSYDTVLTGNSSVNSSTRILVCKNGTIEMEPRRSVDTMDGTAVGEPIKLRDSSRDDLNTMTTGIDYIPWSEIRTGGDGAALVRSREIVEDYLDTFIPDGDLRWYIQRIFGYGMYGANPERKIVFLQGKTSTGKSTILSALSGALGSYAGPFNLSLLRDKQDEGPRAELVNALKRRIITASESSVEWHLHADMIKRVTGGSDIMAARLLFSNEIVERVPAFTPFVATNSSPTIDAADSATWRRLVVLPFDIQVGLDDSSDLAKQKAGRDAFMASDMGCRMVWLSWLVDGYIGYVNEGIAEMPKAVEERTKEFRSGVSDFHTFLNDLVQSDEKTLGKSITSNRLFSAYEAWCFEHRIRDTHKLSKIAFHRKLSANGFELNRRFPRVGEPEWKDGLKTRYMYIDHAAFREDVDEDAIPGKMNMKQFETEFEQ